MKFTKIVLLFLAIFWLSPAWATVGVKAFVDDEGLEYWVGISTDTKPTATTLPVWSVFFETDTKQQYRIDDTGAWVTFTTPVEQQFSYCTDDADLVCKAAPGFLHAITCYGEDAAAEAGSVAVRDATTAGTGTIIWGEAIAAAAYTTKTVTPDILMTTGVVIDFTTTTDVFCVVSYR